MAGPAATRLPSQTVTLSTVPSLSSSQPLPGMSYCVGLFTQVEPPSIVVGAASEVGAPASWTPPSKPPETLPPLVPPSSPAGCVVAPLPLPFPFPVPVPAPGVPKPGSVALDEHAASEASERERTVRRVRIRTTSRRHRLAARLQQATASNTPPGPGILQWRPILSTAVRRRRWRLSRMATARPESRHASRRADAGDGLPLRALERRRGQRNGGGREVKPGRLLPVSGVRGVRSGCEACAMEPAATGHWFR